MGEVIEEFLATRRHHAIAQYACGHLLCGGAAEQRLKHACEACLEGVVGTWWHDVEHVCGHTVLEMFQGRADTIESRRLSRGKKVCHACTRNEREAKFLEDGADALRWTDMVGLQRLRGSIRQVAFAELLRRGVLEKLAVAYRAKPSEFTLDNMQGLTEVEDARVWIEHRQLVEVSVREAIDDDLPLELPFAPFDDEERE